jgi:TonB family protein
MRDYWQAVRDRIASRVRYPRSARRRGVEGIVAVHLTVDLLGNLVQAGAADTGADPDLRASALRAVASAAPFPAPPCTDFSSNPSIVLPVRFELVPAAIR